MAYCRKCGAPISDLAYSCPSCGNIQSGPVNAGVDKGGFGWGLLGCCVPLAGLILYLVWKDQKPKTAKAVGIGALVSTIFSVIWYVIAVVGGVAASVMSSWMYY